MIMGIGGMFHTGGQVGGVPTMHSGGYIPIVAHNGLASDEIPIVAQRGESVLSRRATQSLGVDNVKRLNRGEAAGGGNVTYIINAVDASSFTQLLYKNKASIDMIVQEGMDRNGAIRRSVQAYG
jgi:hypothetical protein